MITSIILTFKSGKKLFISNDVNIDITKIVSQQSKLYILFRTKSNIVSKQYVKSITDLKAPISVLDISEYDVSIECNIDQLLSTKIKY